MLEVLENGHQVPLRGSEQRALLASLLLHANEVASRDRLIDELWVLKEHTRTLGCATLLSPEAEWSQLPCSSARCLPPG